MFLVFNFDWKTQYWVYCSSDTTSVTSLTLDGGSIVVMCSAVDEDEGSEAKGIVVRFVTLVGPRAGGVWQEVDLFNVGNMSSVGACSTSPPESIHFSSNFDNCCCKSEILDRTILRWPFLTFMSTKSVSSIVATPRSVSNPSRSKGSVYSSSSNNLSQLFTVWISRRLLVVVVVPVLGVGLVFDDVGWVFNDDPAMVKSVVEEPEPVVVVPPPLDGTSLVELVFDFVGSFVLELVLNDVVPLWKFNDATSTCWLVSIIGTSSVSRSASSFPSSSACNFAANWTWPDSNAHREALLSVYTHKRRLDSKSKRRIKILLLAYQC